MASRFARNSFPALQFGQDESSASREPTAKGNSRYPMSIQDRFVPSDDRLMYVQGVGRQEHGSGRLAAPPSVCRNVCPSVPADGVKCGREVPAPEDKTRGPHGAPRPFSPARVSLRHTELFRYARLRLV